jgi:hypothetical protein
MPTLLMNVGFQAQSEGNADIAEPSLFIQTGCRSPAFFDSPQTRDVFVLD